MKVILQEVPTEWIRQQRIAIWYRFGSHFNISLKIIPYISSNLLSMPYESLD